MDVDAAALLERLALVERENGRLRQALADGRGAAGPASITDATFMRSVLAASSDCIKVLELDGRLTFMSEGGMRVMEVSDFNAIAGCPWPDFWEGEGHLAARAAIAAAREGRPAHFEGAADTLGGRARWWDVRVSPILGADGRPERILSVSRDVTDRREAELRLARSEERLSLALGAAGVVGIWDWDLQAEVVDADTAFASLYGVSSEAAAGSAPLDDYIRNVHADDQPAFRAELDRLLRDDGSFANEHRVAAADGSVRWVMARGKLVRDADGQPSRFAGVTVDITERKLAEQAVQAMNDTLEERVARGIAERATMEEALRQSQKMEAVGQLTGGLAHDFNNLLAGIGGSFELIQRRIAQGRHADVAPYVDAGLAASKRAAALTHRLLAFSRRQTLAPKPTAVDRLVAGMEDLVRRTVGPAVDVQVVAADGLWHTSVDPNQLENALLNLCINARDAMPDGGRLTISTANTTIDPRSAREHGVAPGDYVALAVTDTGTGMSPETIDRAFEPFFTTKPIGLGTGLGLSMVYGFARQSGGAVRITSALGQGTTMCLYLARHDAAEAHDPPPPVTHHVAGRGERVLVVDDDDAVRMVLVDVLVELGYRAVEARDGPRALALLRAGPAYDLLITDVGLPGGMNGRQLAAACRITCPDLRVLFVTGYAESAAVGTGVPDAGTSVLTKPFSLDALTARLAAIFD